MWEEGRGGREEGWVGSGEGGFLLRGPDCWGTPSQTGSAYLSFPRGSAGVPLPFLLLDSPAVSPTVRSRAALALGRRKRNSCPAGCWDQSFLPGPRAHRHPLTRSWPGSALPSQLEVDAPAAGHLELRGLGLGSLSPQARKTVPSPMKCTRSAPNPAPTLCAQGSLSTESPSYRYGASRTPPHADHSARSFLSPPEPRMF